MRDLIISSFRKWLYIDDLVPLDVIMATALGIFFPGDPLWLLVVGPPGSCKTEILRTFTTSDVYTLDALTQRTFVSGYKEKGKSEKYGIIQDLDGKLFIVKDLTVTLQSTSKNDDMIFGQLRAIYDGEYAAAHGSGHKRQYYKARFGFMAAVTPMVDKYRTINAALGERFLTIRVHQNSIEAIKKSQENCGKEDMIRKELMDTTSAFMEYYKSEGQKLGLPTLCNQDNERIAALGNLTAVLRSEVERDRIRHIVTLPEAEVGTRLVKQLTRLSELLSLYGAYDYKIITRIARDCVNPMRMKVVKQLFKEYKANAYQIHKEIGLTHPTVKELCDDLWALGICEKESRGNNDIYSFTTEILELIFKSEIFDE